MCLANAVVGSKKEFWAKIRGMAHGGSSVEELKRLGWGGALAFFDELPMEEVKKRLGPTCENWGLDDFGGVEAGGEETEACPGERGKHGDAKPLLRSEGCVLGPADRTCSSQRPSTCVGDGEGEDV